MKRKKRLSDIRIVLFLAGIMNVIILLYTLPNVEFVQGAAINTNPNITYKSIGDVLRLTCNVDIDTNMDVRNIKYTWYQSNNNNNFEELQDKNQTIDLYSRGKNGYRYYCEVSGELQHFYDLIYHLYNIYYDRIPDSSGYTTWYNAVQDSSLKEGIFSQFGVEFSNDFAALIGGFMLGDEFYKGICNSDSNVAKNTAIKNLFIVLTGRDIDDISYNYLTNYYKEWEWRASIANCCNSMITTEEVKNYISTYGYTREYQYEKKYIEFKHISPIITIKGCPEYIVGSVTIPAIVELEQDYDIAAKIKEECNGYSALIEFSKVDMELINVDNFEDVLPVCVYSKSYNKDTGQSLYTKIDGNNSRFLIENNQSITIRTVIDDNIDITNISAGRYSGEINYNICFVYKQ